jgi:hypothetical protein
MSFLPGVLQQFWPGQVAPTLADSFAWAGCTFALVIRLPVLMWPLQLNHDE